MSELDSRLQRIHGLLRRIGRPSPQTADEALRFVGVVLRKVDRDALLSRSAALAFVTVMSLVPLLAGLSHFSVGFFADRQDELVDLMARVLPYTEAAITDSLAEFLQKSDNLRGFGFIAFLLTALTAFSMIEKTVNDIWDVPRRRSRRRRTASFVLLICWGPLLIGAAYSAIFLLRRHPTLELLAEALPLRVITFLVTWIGLTMLNLQVPNTRVDTRSALIGGAVSALAIEVLREFFGLYVDIAQTKSFVYGSFGFALLFMLSIQVSWVIVLAGTEIAYCLQHFKLLARSVDPWEPRPRHRLALAAMALVLDRFRQQEPVTPTAWLAECLWLSPSQVVTTLDPLVRSGLLTRQSADGNYLLSCDPYHTPIADVLQLYAGADPLPPSDLPEPVASRLRQLGHKLTEARRTAVGETTLAQLFAAPEDGSEGPPT